MFIRKKKIAGSEYAYLVENKYNKRKKQSRQKSKEYLGKVIRLNPSKGPINAPSIKEALILELTSKGFKQKKNLFILDDISIDLENLTVKQNEKNICLELNEGFLCNKTLTNLFNFNTRNLNEKEIILKFADIFVSAGINLHHDSFISIFNNSIKSS